MKYKQNTVHRKILIINPTDDKRVRLKLNLVNKKVADMLKQSVYRLNLITPLRIPNITFTQNVVDDVYYDLHNTFEENFGDAIKLLRVVIVNDVIDQEFIDTFENDDISHMILAQSSRVNTWLQSNGATASYLAIMLDCVVRVIHDILLDIAMFNSYETLALMPCSDRKKVSEKKVDYSRQIGGEGSYINNTDVSNYVSFASYCWDGDEFNYDLYLKIWNSFYQEYYENGPRSFYICVDPLKDILKNHPKSMQLSKKKLTSALNKIAPGDYLLVTVDRSKPNHDVGIGIRRAMGSIKLNHFKIVQYRHRHKYFSYYPYLSYFKFRVTKCMIKQ